ncbi:CotH kinase family protein [Mariniplasma anaerobium]|uniref:CotH protein n=1 Tax=Mariniplasma anaerobium TaxID=2735436 RepID=A0A7U9TGS6_9MOLU|nr:CotH kinase family protein [Mariniplasma anaerobium]BCR35875.1 hypothetical protein MPAN_007680 [Mariniplasma anaerobium]
MKKIFFIMLLATLVFMLVSCTSNDDLELDDLPSDNDSSVSVIGQEDQMVSEVIYPHDEVVEVNIDIDESVYSQLVLSAMEETYYVCNITYNGYTLNDVAIRTKGNSSLRDVIQAGGDRFSYNIDLNYYQDQDLFGIDKIILNNLYSDPTMMVEYLTYEALASLDTVSSRTTFVALSINNEYYGLYLSVEQVGNEFLDQNFGNSDDALYKPDSGLGVNLNYVSDTTAYTGLIDKNNEDSDNEDIINLMKTIASGEPLDDVFDVSSYLKYLAVSTYTVNLDSYQGGIYHNYYLYLNQGVFEWVAWDLNMAFNGFLMMPLTDSQAVSFLIDEPVVGALSNSALNDAILSQESYLEEYHTYMQTLLDTYFKADSFEERVLEVKDMIDSYVETDLNSFYTYEAFENACSTSTENAYSIIEFVEKRSQNVQAQLLGTIPSTNNGQGNIIDGGNTRPPFVPGRP